MSDGKYTFRSYAYQAWAWISGHWAGTGTGTTVVTPSIANITITDSAATDLTMVVVARYDATVVDALVTDLTLTEAGG